MPRPCTVCAHPRRAEIDRALYKGATERSIMADSGLSKGAVHRHKIKCAGLPHVATKAVVEARHEISRGTIALAALPSREELGGQYAALGGRIDAIVQEAQKDGSLAIAVQGLNTLRQNLDSLSKLAGHTGSGATQVNVGVQVNLSAADIAAEIAKQLSGADAKLIEALVDE